MPWNFEDIPILIRNLPCAVYDLMQHEDKNIVQKNLAKLVIKTPAKHIQISSDTNSSSIDDVTLATRREKTAFGSIFDTDSKANQYDTPKISIEKSIDPMAQRDAQNIGLLLQDYLKQLPTFEVSHADGEKLLEHWREVMLEHPRRLATAQHSHWHDDSSKAFWHDKIASHHTDFGITADIFPDAWDDWQRASGIGHNTGNINQLPAMKQKQWQDLVIRSRLHTETMARWNEV